MQWIMGLEQSYQSAPACRYEFISLVHAMFTAIQTYLGEKVVSEKEYLSAMLGLLLPSFWSEYQAYCVVFEELFSNWRRLVE